MQESVTIFVVKAVSRSFMPATKRYSVSGMHCASCASIIKRKLIKLPGI
ncbi:hypothetical protein COW38_03830, partial [Candidatus Collierbacteria bacterium CG17_big_fil_post_rev_8_21_14_2_50_45_7]